MTIGESQRLSFSFTKRSACNYTEVQDQYQIVWAAADFSKGLIQMLISAPRDDAE